MRNGERIVREGLSDGQIRSILRLGQDVWFDNGDRYGGKITEIYEYENHPQIRTSERGAWNFTDGWISEYNGELFLGGTIDNNWRVKIGTKEDDESCSNCVAACKQDEPCPFYESIYQKFEVDKMEG